MNDRPTKVFKLSDMLDILDVSLNPRIVTNLNLIFLLIIVVLMLGSFRNISGGI
jgi:hypothetical protein